MGTISDSMPTTSPRIALLALAAVLAAPSGPAGGAAVRSAAPRPVALEPASSGGLELVDRALAKLSIHARLLVVGAHPDDEDNALLAWVSRGVGGEAAYLSLSRGEGGQNLIGPELGEPLGLIRTGELLAARRIEGTRQYFARAFDFGYTRSLEETFERWPREILLEDAIRAARRFKPQVVVAIFPADARAGHGQHQASAVIAHELYERLADPGLLEHLGLPPWTAEALYRRAWSRDDDATIGFSLGALDPITGRSVGQIAAASRSQHRSQDMGRTQPLGDARGDLRWIAGGAGADGDTPFAGIDTRLAAIASSLSEGEQRRAIELRLTRAESLARETRAGLAPVGLERAVVGLSRVLAELREARAAAARIPGGEVVADLIDEKIAVAEAGLAAAAGVVVDALADRESVPAGGVLNVTATLWPAGEAPVELLSVSLLSAEGWVPTAGEAGEDEPDRGLVTRSFRVEVPADAGPSVPYFLERPRMGDLYDWSAVPEWLRGEPYRVPLTARFELAVAGTPITLEREVAYRYGDQAVGEIRRPVRSVPPVEVEIEPAQTFFRLGRSSKLSFEITVTSNLDREISGILKATELDAAIPSEGIPLTLPPGGTQSSRLTMDSGEIEAGAHRVAASLETAAGAFGASFPVLDYPHVRPVAQPVPASAEVRALTLELPDLERIGYVRGASDRVPEVLEKVGLRVEVLDLAGAGTPLLSAYDVIVIGSRAYEVDPLLRAKNASFLDYVERGGTLIVQYQQYPFVTGGYAPLPLEIGRPHGRITDESSPVRVLEPDHPVFHRPNEIGASDWDGWVQERGLYFAGEWDPAYTPLLALQDPGGEPEQRGGLLLAGVGAGIYVYTGLSFFRQLPAGVPGALRLFANLLALGER